MNKLIFMIIMIGFFFITCANKSASPDAQYEREKKACFAFALLNSGTSQASQNSASSFLANCLGDAEKNKKKRNARDIIIVYY